MSGFFYVQNFSGEKFIRQRREPNFAPLKLCESEVGPQEKSCEKREKNGQQKYCFHTFNINLLPTPPQ